MDCKIHKVKEIRLNEITKHSTFYSRNIQIKNEYSDITQTITLISENKENLKIIKKD